MGHGARFAEYRPKGVDGKVTAGLIETVVTWHRIYV